jgi:hypothetical protein
MADPTPPRSAGPAIRVFLAHASPRILLAFAVIALATRARLGGFGRWDAAIVLGTLAVWPFQEWLIHVLLLHHKPRTILGVRIDPRNARKHRAHHLEPRRISLVFVPLHSRAMARAVLIGGWLLAAPTAALAWTGIASYAVLALHYEWSHFLAHIPWTPRPYRRICQAHMLHHCKSEKHWYGVSMLLADGLLGTTADPRTLPTSPTVRTLGVDPG